MNQRSRATRIRVPALVAIFGVATPIAGLAQTESDGGLPLPRAVRLAIDWHPALQSAAAEVDRAEGALDQVRAERWPKLSLRASATQFQEPMIVAPLHRFDVNQRPRFDRTLIGGELSLEYTLFDGGARGARIRGSAATAAVSELERDAVRTRLIADVTTAYLGVLTLNGVKNAHDLRIRALASEQNRVDQLLSAGNAARVELLRVAAALAQARAEQVAATASLEKSERTLARLTGLPLEQTRADRLLPIGLRDPALLPDRNSLVVRAEANNPMLAQARQRVDAARSLERSAVAAWLPRIDVGAGYVGFGSADQGSTAEWRAGLRLSYPLFTGGGRQSAVRMTRAQTAVAGEQLRVLALGTADEIDGALSAFVEWEARVVAGTTAVQHLSEVARIEQLSLTEGARTQSDYLRAEAELLRARAQLIEARHGTIAARVALAGVVGELSVEWLERLLEHSP